MQMAEPLHVSPKPTLRALRAARQAGAGSVRILPDGTIQIDMQPANRAEAQEKEIASDEEIVL
jgi:hypothetical protein